MLNNSAVDVLTLAVHVEISGPARHLLPNFGGDERLGWAGAGPGPGPPALGPAWTKENPGNSAKLTETH